jgi:lambda family phage portal protein
VNILDAAALEVHNTSRLRGSSSFQGASTSRLTSSWFGQLLAPNFEIQMDLRTLRARSRQLARDSAWVSGVLWGMRSNVLGPKGIVLQVRLRDGGKEWDPTAGYDKKANAQMEGLWRWWSENPDLVSVDGRTAWLDQEWFFEQTKFIDGEYLGFKSFSAANAFGYALKNLDADYLDEQYNVSPVQGRNEIRMGVEIDADGRPVAYHLWTRHPNDVIGGVRERKRIPAEYITHYFDQHRPGAVRGIPALTAAMMSLRMLDKYKEAELVASVVSSAKMGWIKTSDSYVGGDDELNADGSPKAQRIDMDAEPGLMTQLPVGYEFQAWDPQHPTTAFEAFTRTINRETGMSVGMSYATSSGDLTAVNYSSIRAGLHTERDAYRIKAIGLANRVHRKVFKDVVEMADLKGILPIPTARIPELLRSLRWQSRGWKWVDPLNDAQALDLMIHLGVGNRSEALAEMGGDYEETLQLLKHEEELALEAQVEIHGQDSTGSQRQVNPRQDGSQDGETTTPQRGGQRALRAL